MNSSLITFSGLHTGSFRTRLVMELSSKSPHEQNGKDAKHSNNVGRELESNPTTVKPASCEAKDVRTFGFGSAENLALPTVFEDKITKERKMSKHEKLSTTVNLDVRSADPPPLSPFPSRFVPQRSLDDNSIQLKGVRRIQRNFSSPLPTENKKTSVLGLAIKGRALSDSPAEALVRVSPVITRRHCDSGNNSHNAVQSQGGISRVKSCPAIKAESNDSDKFLLPVTNSPISNAPSTNACATLKPADQADRLPRIHDSRSPMLVRTRKSSSGVRELFNVSPIMDQSGNNTNKTNNIQCNVTDKVEYYLYSMTVEDGNE